MTKKDMTRKGMVENADVMEADLATLDLQKRDGIALLMIVVLTANDPLKRPISHRELAPLLGSVLGLDFKSPEQTHRIASRLRRCRPPLLVTNAPNQGRTPGLAASRTGKELVKRWQEKGLILKLPELSKVSAA